MFWSRRDTRLCRHDGLERIADCNLFQVRKQRNDHPDLDQLIRSYRSSYLVDKGYGSFVWLAYVLPSALVNNFTLPDYDRFIDYCRFSSHVGCTCDTLHQVLAGSLVLFF